MSSKILSKIINPRLWVRWSVVLCLIPVDFLIAASLWFSELVYRPFSRLTRQTSTPARPDLSRASLIVLNWDGKHLLEEFLPSVVEAVKAHGGEDEIIVVDNGSQDDSVEFLHSRFPMVKVVALPENMRFTGGNNAGVQAARNDIVVLLNNDMQVDREFLQPLLEGFREGQVFAVSCQVFFQDRSRRREETGKTRVRWKMGFLEASHDQITPTDERQQYVPIFWGGGGSCAFDRRKFLAIGGLDTLYDPFYLEDTDLSYQAWKRGWKCLLAPKSVVIHKHRGTNKLKFGDNYVDNTIRKNQYLFIWKNITDWKWLASHTLLLPMIQAHLLAQTNLKFEVKAFLRALLQLPEVLLKRYRMRTQYTRGDSDIFEESSRPLVGKGGNIIDFSSADFSEQLGDGWYEVEQDASSSFRWMSRKGSLVLFPQGEESFLAIVGAVPEFGNFRRLYLTLEICLNGRRIFRKRWMRSQKISLKIPIRVQPGKAHWFHFKLNGSFSPARLGIGQDSRELGIIVSSVRLIE